VNRVGAFYDRDPRVEWMRLERHRTEFAVTLRLLEDYLPPAPAEVLDVGGGPGRYAIELARKGYAVTLADLSAGCLALADEKAREAGVELAGRLQADATNLEAFGDGAFDAVLLMGPLYHVPEERGRRAAVAESFRVLRPGGVVFAAFITRTAVLRWSALERPDWLLRHGEELMETGVPADTLVAGSFPGYFADPQEVRPLMAREGFTELALVGCEGAVAQIEDRVNELTGELWEKWVDVNYRVGHQRAMLGAADHLLYVGRKPGTS
jgi:ubiquinone/menaquinone biosynthesis C-methylase UbiE